MNPDNRSALLWLVAGVAGLLLAGASGLAYAVGLGTAWAAGLALGAFLSLVGLPAALLFFNRGRVRDRILSSPPLAHWIHPKVPDKDSPTPREVRIGLDGLWIDGDVVPFTTYSSRFERAEIRNGHLAIHYSVPGRRMRHDSRWDLAIPAGCEPQAREIVETLNRKHG